MFRFLSFSIAVLIGISAMAQAPAGASGGRGGAGASGPGRAGAPTRDPHTAGYVTATELADGAGVPLKTDGNFILGPTHTPAPEMAVVDGVPQGEIFNFTMESTDSKIYPGIARDTAGGRGAPITSHPAPYTRKVAVYVPKQYVPGTVAPFIVGADGPDPALFAALNDRPAPRACDDCDFHRQRRQRRAGQRTRSGIRHHVTAVCGVRREGSFAHG